MTIANLTIDPATGIREITAQGTGNGQYFTNGRNAKGRFATWDAVRVTVTPRGHWYRSDDAMDAFSNDRLCRGCGHHGHFDYILDYEPCPKPATVANVEEALLGWSTPKPALDEFGCRDMSYFTVTGGTEF